jgi:hypothetical protein
MKIKQIYSNSNEIVRSLGNHRLHLLSTVVENHLTDQEQSPTKAAYLQETASAPATAEQLHSSAKPSIAFMISSRLTFPQTAPQFYRLERKASSALNQKMQNHPTN